MPIAITGARIFDGKAWHDGRSLLVDNGRFAGIVSPDKAAGLQAIDVSGKTIVPGFIDLQVNGGGGVLFNDQPTADGIRAICRAHARFGTTSLLATLITDRPDVTVAAIAAGHQARAQKILGFLGLHLEGPHLSIARKGVHDPSLIRPMTDQDLRALVDCKRAFAAMMVTIAPENVTTEQVGALAAAGIIVSLGHTDTDYRTARDYAAAGATTATHLFNAMSPLGHRQPGMVGAVLDLGTLHSGIITDGIHVDPVSLNIALRSKQGPGRIFIVTDAMSSIGSDETSFVLNGRTVFRRDGRLTIADGTLAGADIDMAASIRFVIDKVGLSFEEAIRMATLYPAEAAGITEHKGRIAEGLDADFVVLDDDVAVRATWIGGRQVFSA